jgi:rubrerythrin
MGLPIDFSKLTAQDVLDMAAFIEREAQNRYEDFAAQLGDNGNQEAARFFLQMAALEGAHGAQVARRRQHDYEELPSHLRDAVEWNVEGPPLDRKVAALSLEAALEMALESERHARDFFAEAMEHLVDDGVRRVLAELHADELAHIRMIEERRAQLGG